MCIPNNETSVIILKEIAIRGVFSSVFIGERAVRRRSIVIHVVNQ